MRIGLVGHNSIEYVEKLFEIWNSGDSAVLIDYDIFKFFYCHDNYASVTICN